MAAPFTDRNGVTWRIIEVPGRPGQVFGSVDLEEEVQYDPTPEDTDIGTLDRVKAQITALSVSRQANVVLKVKPEKAEKKSDNTTLLIVLGLLWWMSRRRR